MSQFLNLEIQNMEQDHEKLISGLESLVLDTVSILTDKENMTAAKEAGLLSDLSVNAFAKNANVYLNKVAPEYAVDVAGLESDFKGNQVAGLESVMDSIKKGLTAFFAFIAKIINNVETFFKNIYTKIMFRVGTLEKKLKELEDRVKEMDDLPTVDSTQLDKTIKKNFFVLHSLNGGIERSSDPANLLMTSVKDHLELLTESKFPLIDKVEDDKVTFKIEPASRIEKILLINILKSIKDQTKIFGGNFSLTASMLQDKIDKSIGARIIKSVEDSAQIIIYNQEGLIDSFPITFDIKSEGLKESTSLNVDKKNVLKAIDALKEAIKEMPKLRAENEKRIKELKQASSSLTKMIESRIKDDEKASRSMEMLKKVAVVWRIYPDINNTTIKSLHKGIEDYTSCINSIVTGKKSDGKTEEVDTEIVE